MDSRLEILFNLLPHKCNSIFIAGGAAVDYNLASDIDLIFAGKAGFKNALQFKQSLPNWRDCSKEYTENGLNLLADGYHPAIDKVIQILWAKDKTAQEVIDKFDISKHAVAYTSRGELALSSDSSEIKVRSAFSNEKTFLRYIKICNRYLQTVDPAILKQLSSKVVKPKKLLSKSLTPKMAEYDPNYTPPIHIPTVLSLKNLENYYGSKADKSYSWDSETSAAKAIEDYWIKWEQLYSPKTEPKK